MARIWGTTPAKVPWTAPHSVLQRRTALPSPGMRPSLRFMMVGSLPSVLPRVAYHICHMPSIAAQHHHGSFDITLLFILMLLERAPAVNTHAACSPLTHACRQLQFQVQGDHSPRRQGRAGRDCAPWQGKQPSFPLLWLSTHAYLYRIKGYCCCVLFLCWRRRAAARHNPHQP